MHLWHLTSRSKNTTGIFSQNVLGAETKTSEAPQYGQSFRPIRRICNQKRKFFDRAPLLGYAATPSQQQVYRCFLPLEKRANATNYLILRCEEHGRCM
jgi:hypothetical protein